MTTRALVAGHVMLDVVVRPRSPIAPSSDTASDVSLSRGGAGANIARGISREGVEAIFIGALGQDLVADLLIPQFDFPVEFHRSALPTGTLVALVGNDGQRAMLTQSGANDDLPGEFLRSAIERHQPAWFHLSGYLLLSPHTREAAIRALASAREGGAVVSTDACSVAPLRDWGPANFVESLRDVSVLFANEEEDAVLAPHLVGRDIDRVITRGAAGARYDGAEGTYEVPAREVTVIDTTGAGDAATGAFIAARLLGLDVESSLAMAMDRAAEVIGRLGA